MTEQKELSIPVTPENLLAHWQGHRNLTRRIIEAFPEDKLFSHSIGGMRTFSEIAMELIKMAAPTAKGIAKGEWQSFEEIDEYAKQAAPSTKEDILKLWDWSTELINNYWVEIPNSRFQESEIVFGTYDGQIWWHLFYIIDNEIHHRGQGYVYLRSLGIEPPVFWER